MCGKCLRITPMQLIVDLGASHHMMSNFSTLINVYKLSMPIIISQPDRRQVKVESPGMVQLGPEMWLKNGICAPRFKCNLFSGQKLA